MPKIPHDTPKVMSKTTKAINTIIEAFIRLLNNTKTDKTDELRYFEKWKNWTIKPQ
jgi:hypothetical protein